MADEWQVESETPVAQYRPAAPAPVAAPSPQAPPTAANDQWQVESETPAQVYKVQQAAAAAPKPAAPVDARKSSDLLGLDRGLYGYTDKLMNRLDQVPVLGDLMNQKGLLGAISPLTGIRDIYRKASDLANPTMDKAEATAKPGGIGKFVGEQLAAAPGYSFGPLVGGGLQGFAESKAAPGDWKQVALDTGLGAATGKVSDVVGGAVMKKVGDKVAEAATKFNPDKAIPALRDAKDAAYKAAHDLGVVYTPDSVKRLQQSLAKAFNDFGGTRTSHGPAWAKLNNLTAKVKAGMPMTLQDVDLLRREIYSDVADLGGETGKLGSNMAAKVQEFMNSAGAHDIATPGTVGDKAAMAQQAQVAMAKARDAAKRYMNVELIDRKLASATSKAKRTYAGGNIDNRIRQTLGPLMDEDSRKNIERFLHPESFEQLVKTVDGTPVQNAMRAVGRLSPLSGGLKALTSATTAAATHGWSTIGSGVGLVSKLAADNATKRNVSDLMEMIATGGTKAGMLAERQLRALAARNSNVGQWLTAIEHDIAETGTRAAVTTEGDARAQIRDRGNQDYEAQKAAAQAR